MTPGCTKQACGFRDAMSELRSKGVEVVGVSGDSVRNHQLFKEAHQLNFTLLADEDGAIARSFGVPVGEGGSIQRSIAGKAETLTRGVTAQRWTFAIRQDGRIIWKNTGVDAAEDYKSILNVLKELEEIEQGGEPSWWHVDLPRQHDSTWLVHDLRRPRPAVVTPGRSAQDAPSDAIVLFDGKDLSQWRGREGVARWTVRDGYAELNNSGDIWTRQEFGDCQLHLEWAAPTPPHGKSQARGNSGIFFMDRYEVQILDSYENATYADGQAASLYGQRPPLVNACRPPGEWQTFDIIFRVPSFEEEEVVEPARATVFHNGVLVQYDTAFFGGTVWRQAARYEPHGPKSPIRIQDHGDGQPLRFRNIWIRELDLKANE